MRDRKLKLLMMFVILACLLAFSGAALAQDDSGTGLLSGQGEQIVLAQSDEDAEEDEGEEGEVDEEEEEEAEATTATLQRGNRMEFDGRLIRGETAGSGAVFLFERAPRPLPSMVSTRRTYLFETVGTVLGEEAAKDFENARAETIKEIEETGESDRLKTSSD